MRVSALRLELEVAGTDSIYPRRLQMRLTQTAHNVTQATILAVFLVCVGGSKAWANDHQRNDDDDNCQQVRLETIAPASATGWGELCVSKERVSVTVQAEHLIPGNAHTLW